MDDEPRRLVDDDKVGVLIDDVEGDRLGRGPDRRRLGQVDHDLGAGRQPESRVLERRALRGRHRAFEDQRLQPRPAERQPLWHRRRQGLVEPLARARPECQAKLAKRLRHGRRDPGRVPFPEPPRLCQLRLPVDRTGRDVEWSR
jgi:hypothetical protein